MVTSPSAGSSNQPSRSQNHCASLAVHQEDLWQGHEGILRHKLKIFSRVTPLLTIGHARESLQSIKEIPPVKGASAVLLSFASVLLPAYSLRVI